MNTRPRNRRSNYAAPAVFVGLSDVTALHLAFLRQIETDRASTLSRQRCDFLDVKQLTCEKVQPAHHRDRDLLAVLVERSLDVLLSNRELAFARSRQNKHLLRIQFVMNDLRFDRVRVGRESRLFHQDLEARFRWPVKRRHHQVNVHRQAVHADDFVRLRAGEPRRRLTE